MFGISETELALIALFGFLLFGPDKLPGMGRTIGRVLKQFRQAQEDFNEVVQTEVINPMNDAVNGTGNDDAAQKKAQGLHKLQRHAIIMSLNLRKTLTVVLVKNLSLHPHLHVKTQHRRRNPHASRSCSYALT